MSMAAASAASPVRLGAVLAWGVGASFFLYAFVHRVSPSVMLDELMREFGVGAAAVGNIAAFYFYAYVALQLPVGALMDRFGPRRLMSTAVAAAAAGSLVFAASEGVLSASAGRLLIGLGCAFSWVGVLVVITLLFPPHRFALFAGLTQAAGMAGGLLGQAPLGRLVESVGWRGSSVWLAAAGLAIAAGILLTVRDGRSGAAEKKRPSLLAGLAHVASRGQSWLAAAVSFSLTATMLSFAGLWAVPFLMQRYGMEKAEAAGLASVGFIGWLVGAPLVGWLSDRLGRRKPLILAGCVTMTLATTAVIYLPGLPWEASAAFLVLGSLAASSMVLTFAVCRDHFPPEDSGVAVLTKP
jgi:MFS family permease